MLSSSGLNAMSEAPRCPKCGSMAHQILSATSTCMGYSSFTDEDGKEHVHNPNAKRQNRQCRLCNHYFEHVSYSQCWCGWSAA